MVVTGPDQIAGHPPQLVVQQLAVCQVFEINRVNATTLKVNRIGQYPLVGANLESRHLTKGLATSQFVDIKQHHLGSGVTNCAPAVNRILSTFLVARVIREVTFAVRH